MNKRVLVISDTQSFMVNAIIDNLQRAEYDVKFVLPNVNDISRIEDRPDIFLMYLGEYAEKISEVLVYLKDICLEDEKKLFLIGNDSEFKTVFETIPENVVSGTFDRPLNVKLLVEHLDMVVAKAAADSGKKHILVVDDDALMLRTIKTWLSEKYQVAMVNSGMNAITYLAKNKPDLILLDYEMPVLNGKQVLEMIRSEKDFETIPIIFLTSCNDRAIVMDIAKLRPEGYLLKTMDPERIISEVDSFFAKRKEERFR